MTQTVILAAGQTAAAATDVTVPVGGAVTFSIRSATAGQPIPRNIGLPIKLVVGADEQTKHVLTAIEPATVIAAPGLWRVRREDISAYGVDIQVLVDQ